MRKRPNARRNIILFAAAVLVIVGLIVAVGKMRHTVIIMPPESSETMAQRQSPDNAYLALEEAARALPAAPGDAPQAAQGSLRGRAKERAHQGGSRMFGGAAGSFLAPKPSTVGGWFGTDRPDDDPEIAAYARQCEPVLAKVGEALNKPYLLPSVDWKGFAEMPWNLYQPAPPFVDVLGNTAMGEGAFATRVNKDAVKGAAFMLTAARLGAIIQRDGPISFYERGGSLQQNALRALDETFSSYPDDKARDLLKELAALRQNSPSPVNILEFQWRVIDNVMRLKLNDDSGMNREDRELGVQFMFNTQMKGLRQLVATHREDFAKAVALSYPEFVQWKASHPAITQGGGRFGGTNPVNLVNRLVRWHALVEACYAGAELSLALELRHRINNKYPDTLEPLAPEFFPAVPADPFTGKPFVYRVEGDGYWLYSAGFNQTDDGGREQDPQDLAMTMWFGEVGPRGGRTSALDIVIHRPPPVAAPPAPAKPAGSGQTPAS